MKINALLAVLALLITSCQSDPKNNLSITNAATSSTTPPIAQPAQTPATHGFELLDTLIGTTANKSVKRCLPLKTPIPAPNFNVTLTKSALNGTATPSVSDGQLCINYVPNPNFSGKDQFDFKVCNGTADCIMKTWKVDVRNDAKKEAAAETTTVRSKTGLKKETLPVEDNLLPTTPPPTVNRRSLFDPNTKNEDGYVPKSNNQ